MIADDSSKLVNRFKSHLAKCLRRGLSGDAILIEKLIEPWDCDSAASVDRGGRGSLGNVVCGERGNFFAY